ncbi:MAG TPA: hypothetical protein DDW27_04985 [Bacteroidales bacterium]|nr:hypothetical protein [Bacteroidales bacterium]
MNLKKRKYLYFFIPLGLIIKLTITILLLNLPGGCKEEKDKRLFEKESKNITALSISHYISK